MAEFAGDSYDCLWFSGNNNGGNKSGRLGLYQQTFFTGRLPAIVKKVLEVRELRERRMKLQPETTEDPKLIGSSAMMVEFYKQIARIADASASVLIEGESGTGKRIDCPFFTQYVFTQ